jgi:hypothetical protein
LSERNHINDAYHAFPQNLSKEYKPDAILIEFYSMACTKQSA